MGEARQGARGVLRRTPKRKELVEDSHQDLCPVSRANNAFVAAVVVVSSRTDPVDDVTSFSVLDVVERKK